jgi:hypothetical protein
VIHHADEEALMPLLEMRIASAAERGMQARRTRKYRFQ